MITNAVRAGSPGDVAMSDYAGAGLPIPSKVRTAKIATVEEAATTRLGGLPDADWREVVAQLPPLTFAARP